MYLTVIMDWYSRYIVAWELSNSLDSDFCLRALDKALGIAPPPELLHSDQGCQYTAREFSGVLKDRGIAISMSGRGRAYDNIFVERFWRSLKYEEIYKREYDTVDRLRRAVEDYTHHYNTDRPHQALDYHTPWEVYENRLDAAEPECNTGIQKRGSQEPSPAPPTNRRIHSRSGGS